MKCGFLLFLSMGMIMESCQDWGAILLCAIIFMRLRMSFKIDVNGESLVMIGDGMQAHAAMKQM